ncbi:MAG: hypothetical protein GEU80_11000 [Dehalococcoidia bacterium]|nr:hypothetical protein [Dehalococcoidia bacterium]
MTAAATPPPALSPPPYRRPLLRIVATGGALLALAVVFATACTGSGDEPALDALYELQFRDASGQPLSGGGRVLEETPGARVDFEVSGLPAGKYDAVLRQGTCDEPGESAEVIGPVLAGEDGTGGASAYVPREPEQVATDHHVAVLDGEQSVACGDVVAGG